MSPYGVIRPQSHKGWLVDVDNSLLLIRTRSSYKLMPTFCQLGHIGKNLYEINSMVNTLAKYAFWNIWKCWECRKTIHHLEALVAITMNQPPLFTRKTVEREHIYQVYCGHKTNISKSLLSYLHGLRMPSNSIKMQTAIYRQTSGRKRTLVGNNIVDHSDVLVGAAPTTSSLSTQHLASVDWAKTTTTREEKHLPFEIWFALC